MLFANYFILQHILIYTIPFITLFLNITKINVIFDMK